MRSTRRSHRFFALSLALLAPCLVSGLGCDASGGKPETGTQAEEPVGLENYSETMKNSMQNSAEGTP